MWRGTRDDRGVVKLRLYTPKVVLASNEDDTRKKPEEIKEIVVTCSKIYERGSTAKALPCVSLKVGNNARLFQFAGEAVPRGRSGVQGKIANDVAAGASGIKCLWAKRPVQPEPEGSDEAVVGGLQRLRIGSEAGRRTGGAGRMGGNQRVFSPSLSPPSFPPQ